MKTILLTIILSVTALADPIRPQQPAQTGTATFGPGQSAIYRNGQIVIVDSLSGVECTEVCAEPALIARTRPSLAWLRWVAPLPGLLLLPRGREAQTVTRATPTPVALPSPGENLPEVPEPASLFLLAIGLLLLEKGRQRHDTH